MLTSAARTAADLKDTDIKILFQDVLDVFVAKIAMDDGVVLVGRGHYVLHAKGPVAKSYVLCGGGFALTPAATDLGMVMHR